MHEIEKIVVVATVFYSFYRIIKAFLDHSLKRKLINSGHIDKIESLMRPFEISENTDMQKYSSLKWGLVALFTGLGFITCGLLYLYYKPVYGLGELVLVGVIITFVSIGFLSYFFILMKKKK